MKPHPTLAAQQARERVETLARRVEHKLHFARFCAALSPDSERAQRTWAQYAGRALGEAYRLYDQLCEEVGQSAVL